MGLIPRNLFTSRRWDKETGLYYYRARMYNPAIGRFMQTDPIGYADSMNLYLYCLNNPINYTDPQGLWTFDITGTGVGSFAWSGMVSGGLVVDGKGNVGWIKTGGIGGGHLLQAYR